MTKMPTSLSGCRALVVGLALTGCDPAASSPTPTDDSSGELLDTAFRCSPSSIPAIGGFDSVAISGSPFIYENLGRTIDVFSNGNVTISGTGYIDAGAYSAAGSVNLVSGGSLHGTVKDTGVDRPIIDTYDASWIGEYILQRHRNAAAWIPYTDAGLDPVVPSGASYEYTVYAGDTSELSGNLYHFQSIELSGYATVDLKWTVTYIVVDGPVTISSGAWIGSGWGTDLVLISDSTDPITITDTDTWFSGRIYAPYADIIVADGAWVTGSIVGASLDISGDSTVEVTNDALDIWLPC